MKKVTFTSLAAFFTTLTENFTTLTGNFTSLAVNFTRLRFHPIASQEKSLYSHWNKDFVTYLSFLRCFPLRQTK